jgi:D-cysteine desulfhydrase
MGCVLAFNSDPPRRTESNQLLEVVFGAERRFLGPLAMDDLNAAIESIAGELRSDGRRPYVIPVGGSSPLGASAYAAAAEEILADLGHDDVLVITATGSGGTQAGLAARLGHERVLGIDVGALVDPIAAVRRLTIEVAELRGLPAPAGEPRIERDQIGDGYGAATHACLSAIRLAARTEGLLLDPVYSGKAMAGLMALPQSELQATTVVFLATGGVPALFETRYEDWLTGPEHNGTVA